MLGGCTGSMHCCMHSKMESDRAAPDIVFSCNPVSFSLPLMSIITLSLRDTVPLYKIKLTMKCLPRAAEVLQQGVPSV